MTTYSLRVRMGADHPAKLAAALESMVLTNEVEDYFEVVGRHEVLVWMTQDSPTADEALHLALERLRAGFEHGHDDLWVLGVEMEQQEDRDVREPVSA